MDELVCSADMDCSINKNTLSRTGYTFNGWNTKSDGSGTSYVDEYTFSSFSIFEDITLYAQWRINKAIINYNVNGGIVAASTTNGSGTTYSWTIDSDENILRNDIVFYSKINYGESLDSNGLVNYNNSKYLKINKS